MGTPKEVLERLHYLCTATFAKSFDGAAADEIAKSLAFAYDLSIWAQVLSDRPERFLFEKAAEEYLTGLLNLSQGQYRNAFKCLRAVLELCLQGVYLSANPIELQEWLNNIADTYWATLMESDKGPFSIRFCAAFFPEIKEHAKNFQTMARTLYRELSETVHCNVPACIPLPGSFDFNESIFKLWHEKAATVKIIIHFCFTLRYLKSLNEENRSKLEEALNENLGYIEQIRIYFGGPKTA